MPGPYGRAPQEYGTTPPEDRPEQPGTITKLQAIQDGIGAWMLSAFNLLANQVPNRLRYPEVQPVVDIYRPRLKVIHPAGGGTTITVPVPDGVIWELLFGTVRLTTSAVVANRALLLQFFDDTGFAFWTTAGNFSQVASTTIDYAFAPGIPVGAVLTVPVPLDAQNKVLVPLPPTLRLRNFSGPNPKARVSIVVAIVNAQAGDQLNLLDLALHEWVEATSVKGT